MQPFVAAEHIKNAYRRYIQTSFPIRRLDLRARFERLIEDEKLLWQEPFISLSRPFHRGASLDELIAEGVLSHGIKACHWPFSSLFAHQAVAVRRLSTLKGSPENTILATGTGSGKTEAFIVPIADDCLRNKEPAGVRAVILYPMNALVNDQLKRLRVQLAGTGVTFGRYTGDTPLEERSANERRGWLPRPPNSPREERYYRLEIQERPPQILVTNYTMLELLLLRKREQEIFHGVKPRFLVLDEVHTYTGILGTEVACLIRRLKEHAGLRPGELVCVGTSATVKSSGAGEDDRRRILAFATELFAEVFPDDSIIEERYQAIPEIDASSVAPPRPIDRNVLEAFNPDDPRSIAALYQAWSGRTLRADGPELSGSLFEAISERPEFVQLERLLTTPRPLSEVVDLLKSWPGRGEAIDESVRTELTTLFLLGCAAAESAARGDPQPRFRPKVHLQIRSLASLNSCLACDSLLTDGRVECSSGEHEGIRKALGLGICRSCGQDYLLGHFARTDQEEGRRPSVGSIERVRLSAADPEAEEVGVLFLYPGPKEDFILEEGAPGAIQSAEFGVCPSCLTASRVSEEGEPSHCDDRDCLGFGDEPLRRFAAFTGGHRCPICQGQGRGNRPEIITPLRSGAASSVSVLTQSLFPQLKPRSAGGTDEKKVLIFADSRQDTAHQAGYLRDRHQTFTQRQLLFQVLQEMARDGHPVVPLANEAGNAVLATEMFLHVRQKYGEADALNFLTPVGARSAEDAGFYDPERVVSEGERRSAIERLRFDLAIEFTDRANTRNSLEREGLATVVYPGLAETAKRLAAKSAEVGISDTVLLESLIRAALDLFRHQKAVDYEPFRDYLGQGADSVKRGIARPTRQTRMPVGYDQQKRGRQNAYEVKALYNRERPGSYRTALYEIFARACPHLAESRMTRLIDLLVEVLENRRYLRRVEIGKLSGRYGNLSTRALQLREQMLEVTVGGERYRCDACQRTYGYKLIPGGGDHPICTSWRCAGKVRQFTPDREKNFYVRLYTEERPERLYTMEHSGQLSGDERVIIEEKFREGLVNALVCTPTLELGVDIGDLVALVLRNVPPTPSNYSQRAGRAGRQKRIALVLTHAGQGPHDSYFFQHPEEMIVGAIRPPTFLLDNRVVIDRHLNSLILEKLRVSLPSQWEQIRTEEGRLREDVLQPFGSEIAGRLGDIQAAVARAFVKEKLEGGLAWLNEGYVRGRIDAFMGNLRAGLDHWCARYREIYEELRGISVKIRKSSQEMERERKLNQAIESLEKEQRHFPLSYLAQVGFLPRYGFPGDTIVVRDWKEREISQAAPVGIVEFAPGNVVYVAGRKLLIDRIIFPAALKEDPRQNAETYRFCPACSFVTKRELDYVCEHCGSDLSTGRYLDYLAARGSERDYIGQEDEYRDREDYEIATYLKPEFGAPAEGGLTLEVEGWGVRYSRLRTVEIYNRGRRDRRSGSIQPFLVCLECGKWREREGEDQEAQGRRASGHLPTCTVASWDADEDGRIERALHLRTCFQGDVIEFGLSPTVAEDPRWVSTFDQAIRLGLQLELFVGPKEVGSFAREVTERGVRRRSLVLYDTMPGGTGYLRTLANELPRILGRAQRHLEECPCDSACYKCLKEFWNQRIHERLDKRLVLTALRTLASANQVPLESKEADSEVRFDSFLEAKFYKLLEENGLPLPATQKIVRSADGRWIVRADFTYENPPLVVLTNGRRYHAADPVQVVNDLERRNDLEIAGRRLLEFSYKDVLESPQRVLETLRIVLGRQEGASATVEFSPRHPSENEQVLGRAMLSEGSRGGVCGTLSLSCGDKVETAFCNPESRIGLILVDERQWIESEEEWVMALRLHTTLRLSGWRVLRVPLSALDPAMLHRWAQRVAQPFKR